LRGDLAPLVQRVRHLQRMPALDVRVDAPCVAVANDVAIAFRRRHGQACAGARVVDEDAVAVPDLGDDFRHAGRAICAGPGNARLAAAQQVVNSG
jgi:hypothetical protein